MNLWISSHFLVAGLFLSSSALTPEECQPLVTPLSLADPSIMYGRGNFLAGYSDNEVHSAMMKLSQSSWTNITASPSSPNEVVMNQLNKMKGTCFAQTLNVTIDGNTATASSRESSLKDSDMEHFKKQASCLGFSREPDFPYDPKNGFCAEGEGIKMPF